MVFESVLTDVLNRVLGEYVENLDCNQLRIGIWGGDVVLKDLVLKQTALKELDLPVQAVYGRLAKLVLNIPWQNLYYASVEARVEGLYIVVEPNLQSEYNAAREEKKAFDAKQAELEKIETAKRKQMETKKVDDSFVEKLTTQIIRNVQITIKDIHVRYEDKVTNPERPFAFGVTLSNLSVHTTNEEWIQTVVYDTTTKIFKIVDLEGLAVYWNCGCDLYGKMESIDCQFTLQKDIATKDFSPPGFDYLLGPINATAKLQLNPRPDLIVPAFSIPKAVVNLKMERLAIGVTKAQYQDLIAFADSMDLMLKGVPYRQFRPNVPYRGHSKEWWRFAYTCIMESEILRRKNNWDWKHMKEHRDLRKSYADAYKTKLQLKKCPQEILNDVASMEMKLDVLNIVMIRQQIQLELERLGKAQETKKGSSWLSGWWSKSQTSDVPETTDLMEKFKAVMTQDEKRRLYKAIDYKENALPDAYPRDFVDTSCTFILQLLEVSVSSKSCVALHTKLQSVKCKVKTRAASSGLGVYVNIDNLSVSGVRQEQFIPELITSKTTDDVALLDVVFELNPINSVYGQRCYINAKPLKAVYDAVTVNKIVDIFTVPQSSALEQLSAVTANTMSEVKMKSGTGLKYMIDNHVQLDLKVDLHAPYIIIPYGGMYTGTENVVVLNLGNVKVMSQARAKLTNQEVFSPDKEKHEILEELRKESYNQFVLELSDVQLLLAPGGEDWLQYITEAKNTNLHILNPLSLEVQFSQCIIRDDPCLPLCRVRATLPSISLKATDFQLLLLASLFNSIPFPQTDVPENIPLSASEVSRSSTVLQYLDLQETKPKLKKEPSVKFTNSGTLVQLTKVDAEFIMKEFSIMLSHQEYTNSPIEQVAVFSITSLECKAKIQTLTTTMSVKLGYLDFNKYHKNDIVPLISTPICSMKGNYLFLVDYVQVDKSSAEFESVYGSCESHLNVNFAMIKLVLHQEALQDIMKYLTEVQVQFDEINRESSKNRLADGGASIKRRISTTSSMSIKTQITKPAKKNVPKVKVDVADVILFKLNVLLDELQIEFASDARNISSWSIKTIISEVVMKNTCKEIKLQITGLFISDLNPNTCYPKILYGTDKEAINARIVIYDEKVCGTRHDDMEVTVSLGCLKIIFLNVFISTIIDFMNQFQRAQAAIIEASYAAAEQAKQNVTNVYQNAVRITLGIKLKAPDIIIPENSHSFLALSLDLGHLTIENKFVTLDIKSEQGQWAVVDNMQLKLTEFKLSRIKLDDKHTITHDITILQPITFDVNLKRNLSASWYKAIPDLYVFGEISSIKINVGQEDYKIIMNTINGNLAEAPPVEHLPQSDKSVMTSKSEVNVSVVTSDLKSEITNTDIDSAPAHVEEAAHIFLKYNFIMNSFIIGLFTTDAADNTPEIEATKFGLANFALEGLSIKGRILTDNTINTSVLLVDCILDDTRPGKENTLNRLFARKSEEHIECVSRSVSPFAYKSMIDITFKQKAGDIYLDLRISSFSLILSMEFLNAMNEFTTIALREDEPAVKDKHTVTQTRSATSQHKPPTDETSKNMITLNLKIEKPDIILVEHMKNIDTRALILNAEMLLKYRLAGNHQVINGVIKDLQLYTCCYNPEERASTLAQVVHPFTISVAGSTPENKGLHIEVSLTNIHLRLSPAIIELLNRAYVTMYGDTVTSTDVNITSVDQSELWAQQPFKEKDFWFLKTEVGYDVCQAIDNAKGEGPKTPPKLAELCIFSAPFIVVTVEAGIGNKTLPMLLMESHFSGKIRNWSTELSIEAVLTLEMEYYNSHLALWEPLIEPIEGQKDNLVVHNPWELKFEVLMNNSDDLTSITPTDDMQEIIIPQPKMSIELSSATNMELTITKTSIEVLMALARAFAAAVDVGLSKKVVDLAPYRFINNSGLQITLSLGESSFQVFGNEEPQDVVLDSGADVALQLKSIASTSSLQMCHEVFKNLQMNARNLLLRINELKCELKLNVLRADKRYFSLKYRGENNDNWGVVSTTTVENGVIIVTLSSIVKVHNYFDIPIDVYYMTVRGNELECIGSVDPGSALNVPLKAVYSPTSELFFSVANYSVTNKPFIWKDLQLNLSLTQFLHSLPKNNDSHMEPFVIKVVGEVEQVYLENTNKHTMSSTMCNIYLRPAVVLRNCLPIDVIVCVQNMFEDHLIKPGDTTTVPNIDPGNSYVVIRLPDYLEREWSCKHDITKNPAQFSVWLFESYDGPTKLCMDLGMHVMNTDGSLMLSLYCPFWMLNKTELNIGYRKSKKTEKQESAGSPIKNGDDNVNVIHHPSNFKGSILFSFNAKNFFGKKKAAVRIEHGGEWSDKFSIDVAGSSGVVICKFEDRIYQFGVHIQLTYNGLTKQVTFTPYYIIINSTHFPIECQEFDRPGDHWTHVEPQSCSSFWPRGEKDDKLIKLRVAGTNEVTAPFYITESHTSLLKLKNKYGGVNVDIQITEGAVYVNITRYEPGMAPALIINHTRDTLNLWEKETVQLRKLEPNSQFFYTWENPAGQRVLVWEGGYKKEIEDDLRMDGGGEYEIAENNYVYWISFLDGMQRTLLFTCDKSVVEEAQSSRQLQQIDQEVTISIHGLGVSFVDNKNRKEIMYIGVSSSGIIWESCRLDSKRFKQMTAKECSNMEATYQQFLMRKSSSMENIGKMIVDQKTEVDFDLNVMLKPHNRKIRRTFTDGLWIQMTTNTNLFQLHAKINRLQIDNQIFDCVFPVTLAPVAPPKSVAGTDVHKPFAELSIVQLLMKHSQIKQYKYFKILIQEFHIKLDLGFVNALMDLLQTSVESLDEQKEKFLLDMDLVNQPLFSHVSSQSLQEQKSFYDLLHFSPLKIHVSFSMAAAGAGGQGVATPNFINVLLQGLGVTLTDMQDVVFKLAFFQREYTFLTQKQLMYEASGHYVGQAVKQLYVLVLGLDVLGNPYGLVLGITKGVEDLFYEPFQGAIQGPGEFAEGLVLGFRSLFGSTVGGAAGAVSRITGAMGKGIAALTFDKEYQRKRRDQLNKKPATVQEGIARSGKGLVMGVYDGVTGVFKKPITGAKEHGVGGFIKGLGKGAVGLVTRPTAGVIDFASSSLDTVKRVTEMSNEEMNRLRPPRFIHADGLVRPYNTKESKGHKLLSELEKGKYANTDVYVYHFIVIDKKEAVLLTDKRLAYIIHDIFGGWAMDWSYTWQEVHEPPKIVPKGVTITLGEGRKKKSNFFGASEGGKTILIADHVICEEICNKIKELQRNA